MSMDSSILRMVTLMTNYKQYDSRWAQLAYPRKPWVIRNCGCGEVAICNAITMMPSMVGQTPKTIQPYMKQFAESRGNGTYHYGIPTAMKHYGCTEVMEHTTMQKLFAELAKGSRIAVLLMGSRDAGNKGVHWTGSGHFICVNKYKKQNGKHYLYVTDSASTSSLRNGWITYEDNVRGACLKCWSGKLNMKAVPLDVDGYGGVATISRLQQFLGITVTGEISITKARHSCCPSVKSVTYENEQSQTVRYMQKWCGVLMDGYWGSGTSKALQKKLGIKQTGTFDRASMKALQKYLNSHTKATYPTLTRQQKAQQFAYDCYLDGYKYIFFTDEKWTQKCPFCNGYKGDKFGGNCIKFAWGCLYHGGGIPCRHDGETINNATADKLIRLPHKEALALIQSKTGVKEWQLIRSASHIPAEQLRIADVLLYYDSNGYTHTALYVGNGRIADCTSSNGCQYGGAYNYGDNCMVAIRYIGK